MKVLHVGEYVQGGVATYIKHLLHHPNETDIEDYIICSENNSNHTWNIPENHVHYYPYERSLLNIFKAMLSIHRYVHEIQPDIIYCHSTWAGVFLRTPFLFFYKNDGLKIIYNAHGWSFLRDTSRWKKKIYAFIERFLLKVTDAVVNVSESEYRAALEYGFDERKQKLIYSGVPIEIPEDTQRNTSFLFDHNKINLLFVGRFDAPKGVDYLLAEFKKCRRGDLHLNIIGDRVVGDSSRIAFESTENITFWGWIPHNRLYRYYQEADVVILPSRWEAFGLVAIEGMKYSKPLIVSNRGALPELIDNEENGFIFDFNHPNSLQQIFLKLDKSSLKNMGKKGREIFLKRYQQKFMLDKTISLYRL